MRIITVIALLFCLIAFSQVAEANSVVTQWNQLLLNTVKQAKTAPPYFSRILYIVHQAMFDAWAMYDATAISSKIGPAVRRPLAERTLDNKNKAVSFAAFVAFNDLYPAYKANSTALMTTLGYDANDTSKDLTTPSGIGNFAAFCLISFRHGDGSNQLGDLNNSTAYSDYTGYTPTNTPDSVIDPNLWQPLRVNNNTQKYVGPHWGNVQTFANDIWSPITSAPYLTPSQNYTDQCQEILNYSANLTDTQKMTAEYWAGGPGSVTPPGLWNQIAQFVSNRDSYDLDKDVKLFFMLNAAMFDASVVCWGVKRYYNSVRPITAIRYLFQGKTVRAWGGPGQGTKDILGETWQPYQELTFVTPAFPAFTSGHSTFSSAGAQILRKYTGSDNLGFSTTLAKGSSTIEPGVTPATDITLTFPTFTSAANDAGISRLYGGIHFAADNVNGQSMGTAVGTNVYTRGSNLIAGTVFSPATTPTPAPTTSAASSFSVSLFALALIAVYMF